MQIRAEKHAILENIGWLAPPMTALFRPRKQWHHLLQTYEMTSTRLPWFSESTDYEPTSYSSSGQVILSSTHKRKSRGLATYELLKRTVLFTVVIQ